MEEVVNWPIRFDTVKDMPEAMKATATGNWLEYAMQEREWREKNG